MNCRTVRKHLVDLLDGRPDEDALSEIKAHLHACLRCAQEYDEMKRALTAIRPSYRFGASPSLKSRVMTQIAVTKDGARCPARHGSPRASRWRPALAAGVAALVLVAAGLSHWLGAGKGGPRGRELISAFSLLRQAWAAEDALLPKHGIAHIRNEVVVKPVANAELARLRWLPVCSLEATGKSRIHQLSLPADAGESYTVADDVWYDSATGRFAHVMSVRQDTIFANAYDGTFVYSSETSPDGALRIAKNPIVSSFKRPQKASDVFGIAAGFRSTIDEKSGNVQDAGEGTLADGSPVRIVKAGMAGPDGAMKAYWLFKIRKDNGTIAEMESLIDGESQLVVRRARTETVAAPAVPWNLANVGGQSPKREGRPKPGITPDMVVRDVSVQHMIEKADFETYIFASNPPWTVHRRITDCADPSGPTSRMFSICYRARDRRHVVLVQSRAYNQMLGPLVRTGRVVYTSPNGFKVWSGPRDQWVAAILLESAGIVAKPADDRTGYALESPAGTFPCLGVNGPMTDEELHALIDSLVPATEHAQK